MLDAGSETPQHQGDRNLPGHRANIFWPAWRRSKTVGPHFRRCRKGGGGCDPLVFALTSEPHRNAALAPAPKELVIFFHRRAAEHAEGMNKIKSFLRVLCGSAVYQNLF